MPQPNSLLLQFFQEALDLLAEAEGVLLELEQYGKNVEKLNSLFRLFHTLKGNSNMVGEEAISGLTHSLETELDRVRSGRTELDSDLLQLAFEVIDVLSAVAREGNSADHLGQIEELNRRLRSLGQDPYPPESSSPPERGLEKGGTDLSGAPMPSPEEVKRASFHGWINLLRHLYRFRSLYEELKKGEGDFYDLLMDMGMESIGLRSEAEELSASTDRAAVYLEKAVAAFAREEIPYNEISYEIVDLLLSDISRWVWEELFRRGALMYRKIINMDELKGLEEQLSDDRKLWVLDLVFDSSDMRRSNDFFAGIARLNKSLKVPFIFISSKTDYYRKATALLDGVLEGFPRVAGDIEEGVKFYLEREDRNG